MNCKSNNIEYKYCIKCKAVLTRLNEGYCNRCNYKPFIKKPRSTVKHKIFMAKFDSKKDQNIKPLLNKYSGAGSGIFI
jgi:DNA-directed RNA polymerase subunit RPC12/RpoP